MKVKRFFFFFISLLMGAGLFFWIIGAVGWTEIKRAFLVFAGWQGIVVVLLTAAAVMIENQRWKAVLSGQNVNISFWRLWNLYTAGYAIRYLAPMSLFSGETLRGYFLNKKYSVPWPKGVASVIIDRILSWTANLIVISLGICFFFLSPGLKDFYYSAGLGYSVKNLALIFGGIFFFFAFGMTIFYFRSFKKQSIIRLISRLFPLIKKVNVLSNPNGKGFKTEEEIFNFFQPKQKAMWKGLAFSLLRSAVLLLRTWFLVLFLGKYIAFLPAVSLLSFSLLAGMVPVPAQLGAHEAAQVIGFGVLGLEQGTGAAFSMIIRGAELTVSLVGLIILFKLGMGLLKNAILKKADRIQLGAD